MLYECVHIILKQIVRRNYSITHLASKYGFSYALQEVSVLGNKLEEAAKSGDMDTENRLMQ